MLFAGKWMVLEIIMLSEISQTEKSNVTCSLSYVDLDLKKKRHDCQMNCLRGRSQLEGRGQNQKVGRGKYGLSTSCTHMKIE
jgi:hypothetical protein